MLWPEQLLKAIEVRAAVTAGLQCNCEDYACPCHADAPKLAERVRELQDAIAAHRAAKADDRCIEDDDRLYQALGDGIKCDRRVGDKAAMLRNCERFIANRTEGGVWKSYAALEQEYAEFRALVKKVRVAQKAYFKGRAAAALAEAKRLEAELDDVLAPGAGLFDQGDPVA